MAFNLPLHRGSLPLIRTLRLVGAKSTSAQCLPHFNKHSGNGRFTCRTNKILTAGLHTSPLFRDSSVQNVAAGDATVHLATEQAPQIGDTLATQISENADVVYHSWGDNPANLDLIYEGLEILRSDGTILDIDGIGSMWTPVGWIQDSFEMFHIGGGIPWFASIAASTILMRIIFYYIVVRKGLIYRRKLEYLGVYSVNDEVLADRLLVENNLTQMGYYALPIFHGCLWYTYYSAITKMIAAPFPLWTSGGYSWFMDITVPDPNYILPLLASGTSLLWFNIWDRHARTMMNIRRPMVNAAYVGVGATFIPAAFCPAAFLSFWITTNVVSIVQALLMKYKGGRKFLGIPEHDKYEEIIRPLLPPGEQKQ